MPRTKKQKQTDGYRALFLITAQRLDEKVQDIFEKRSIPVQYHIFARGTASSEINEMLGLGNVEKTVTVSALKKSVAKKMLDVLTEKLYLGAPNSGVAFTIPITSGNAGVVQLLESMASDEEGSENKMDNNYSMIIAFVNQGYSDDVMAAARPAGAGGGTVFHGRRVGNDETLHMWGINIQPEREIVMILAKKDRKIEIMKAISEKCGVHTEAHGMIISLPVDDVAGLIKNQTE